MIGPFLRPFTAKVAHITTAIFTRIAVKDFLIKTGMGYTNAIMAVGLGSKITDHHQKLLPIFAPAQERNDAMTIITTVDPLKAILTKILGI